VRRRYLGPAFAVLLLVRVEPLGVAWLRIASAAVVFALWRRPWRVWRVLDRRTRWLLGAWAAVLAVMNSLFYLAIDRLPLGTVAAIEFLPVVALAAIGTRTGRNLLALGLAVGGVYLLSDVRLVDEPLGFAFAAANAFLFALYIVLGHRVAQSPQVRGIDGLALSMLLAATSALRTPVSGDVAQDGLELLDAEPAARDGLPVVAVEHRDERVDRARVVREPGGGVAQPGVPAVDLAAQRLAPRREHPQLQFGEDLDATPSGALDGRDGDRPQGVVAVGQGGELGEEPVVDVDERGGDEVVERREVVVHRAGRKLRLGGDRALGDAGEPVSADHLQGGVEQGAAAPVSTAAPAVDALRHALRRVRGREHRR
jgi:hypothetical protein